MEEFENNSQTPENTDNSGENAVNTETEAAAGVFAEKSFAEPENAAFPASPMPQSAQQPVSGYQQPVQGQYYYPPQQPDSQYRNMYAAQQYQQPQYQQQYQPQYQYQQQYPQYTPPVIPPVSDTPETTVKKSSKAWIIVVIAAVLLLLSAVMLGLAENHKNDSSESGGRNQEISHTSGGSGVTININVAPKPVEDESLYQNKETGLLTTAGAAQQVLPSIVNLYGYTNTAIRPYNEASGVIISDDGYIITNAHAVEDITRFKARLGDDREFEAELIGTDTKTDLAVLKIDAENLTPAVIGNSDELIQGEEVIAIGNAGGFNNTVTVGNVSYVNREIKSYTGYPITSIQTDAALNFGNSGGALVNLYGQVVGIVVSKYSSDGSENIGFAIATSFAVPIVEDLIENGYITDRPRIGITYTLIDAEMASSLEVKPGMLISEIDSECDVAKTELKKDDIITEMDGKQILTDTDIRNFQNTHKAGETVTAKVYRKTITGEESEFEISFKLEQDKN